MTLSAIAGPGFDVIFIGLLVYILNPANKEALQKAPRSRAALAPRFFCCLAVMIILWLLELTLFFGLRPNPASHETVLYVMTWFIFTAAQALFFVLANLNARKWEADQQKLFKTLAVLVVILATTKALIFVLYLK